MWHESQNATKDCGLPACIVQQEMLVQLHRAHLKSVQPRHHGKVGAVQKFRVGITRACQRQKIAVPQDKLQITYTLSHLTLIVNSMQPKGKRTHMTQKGMLKEQANTQI